MTARAAQCAAATFDRPTDKHGHRPRWTADEVDNHQALEEEFREWATAHGPIWFENESRLAARIAFVLDIDLEWMT